MIPAFVCDNNPKVDIISLKDKETKNPIGIVIRSSLFHDRFKLVHGSYMLVVVLQRVLGRGMKNVAADLVKNYFGLVASEHCPRKRRMFESVKQNSVISHKEVYQPVLQ